MLSHNTQTNLSATDKSLLKLRWRGGLNQSQGEIQTNQQLLVAVKLVISFSYLRTLLKA